MLALSCYYNLLNTQCKGASARKIQIICNGGKEGMDKGGENYNEGEGWEGGDGGHNKSKQLWAMEI